MGQTGFGSVQFWFNSDSVRFFGSIGTPLQDAKGWTSFYILFLLYEGKQHHVHDSKNERHSLITGTYSNLLLLSRRS